MDRTFSPLGLRVPDILLPNPDIDLFKWTTIACDQHTSNSAYWQQVEEIVEDAPSTYQIVYPEIYLRASDEAQRITAIQRTMRKYLAEGVLTSIGPGFILVERTLPDGRVRTGLIAAVDLKAYEYAEDSRSLIRPTEGTIVERIPPRVRIREGAALESPHIMVLLDDPGATVLEPLAAQKDRLPLAYDTDLMLGGGHVRGYHIREKKWLDQIARTLTDLLAEKSARSEYPLLFAIGDGNHSLATAKAHWDTVKKTLPEAQRQIHPARYALVEILNIHDPGIRFEPIHRVLFSMSPEVFRAALPAFGRVKGCYVHMETISVEDLDRRVLPPQDRSSHTVGLLYENRCELLTISPGLHDLPAGTIEEFLKLYLLDSSRIRVDYIHGKEALVSLCQNPDTVGIYLPPVSKQTFFDTIETSGVMPQKTFSMGEAEEKRYYLECRRIIP